MSKFLLTQSLLGAWLYQYQALDEEKAYSDFLKTLNREHTEPTKAMLAGIEFEDKVTEYCKTGLNAEDKCVKAVGDIVKGGQFQVALSRDITVCGIDFVLYGKLDALKAGIIYDIKRSDTYEVGKYTESPQHPMYFFLTPEARRFDYLISDGKDVFTESYTRAETQSIIDIVKQFISYIKDCNLLEVYKQKWVSKY